MIDSARLQKYLETNGWQIVKDARHADFVFFNACGATGLAESFSLNAVKYLRSQMRKTSSLVVWGCLPKINPGSLRSVYNGPLLGERELFETIDQVTESSIPVSGIVSNEVCRVQADHNNSWLGKPRSVLYRTFFRQYISNAEKFDLYRPEDDSIFYIKTSSGCLGKCSYCAIRNSRGVINSKPLEAIMTEFRSGLEAGYHEFSLLGTDLGGQGRDLGYGLCDLLAEMIREQGDYRIGIRNINPFFLKQMLGELEPILQTGKIWFIGMAVESGSNRILRLMRRQYTVEDYIECFHRVKAAWPQIVLRNQMLVGFPTETKEDFDATLRLMESLDIDHNEAYGFSARPGTDAARMDGQVPQGTIRLRLFRVMSHIHRRSVSRATMANPRTSG